MLVTTRAGVPLEESLFKQIQPNPSKRHPREEADLERRGKMAAPSPSSRGARAVVTHLVPTASRFQQRQK